MSSLSRNRSTARWPFWLLIAAWACANSPQAATYALLTWFGEARHFTHQQRLTGDVAFLLGGDGGQTEPMVARSENTSPTTPLPTVPVEAVLKKISLSTEGIAEVLPPALRARRPWEMSRECRDSLRVAPPHEPPRLTGV